MKTNPAIVTKCLSSGSIAVAGVSRDPHQSANVIFKKLKASGRLVFPVNPNADTVEGEQCYPDIASLPQRVDAAMIVTHPERSANIVKQCSAAGVMRVWFHRSFGQGSVSDEAVLECERNKIECIIGGCPMMYCEPVDPFHRCMRWFLRLQRKVPG